MRSPEWKQMKRFDLQLNKLAPPLKPEDTAATANQVTHKFRF